MASLLKLFYVVVFALQFLTFFSKFANITFAITENRAYNDVLQSDFY